MSSVKRLNERYQKLIKIINQHNLLYHTYDSPSISDLEYDELYNELKNIDLINELIEITDSLLKRPKGTSVDLINYVSDRPGHDFRYSMNSDKLRNEMNWKPKIDFDTGLENTINWYASNPDWQDNISEHIFEHTPWKK